VDADERLRGRRDGDPTRRPTLIVISWYGGAVPRIVLLLVLLVAGCGARTELGVGDAGAGGGGIPCGATTCAPHAQLCAHCDLPDDDGSFDAKCIDIPKAIPDWWGARFPDCERPVATISCGSDGHCDRGERCLTEGRDTFCTVP
jgi:hypothetical protein